MLDDYDTEKIKTVALTLLTILFIIIGIILYIHYNALEKYRPTCEKNPKERYAEPCKNYDDCVNLCMKRLRNTAS